VESQKRESFRDRVGTEFKQLLDHLIGLKQQRRGNAQAEGFGGLEIDGQLKLHRLLHRQVPWLGAFQDAIHIVGAPAANAAKFTVSKLDEHPKL